MNKTAAFICVYKSITTNNYLFTHLNTGVGDNILQPFIDLKTAWEKMGINACTPDMVNINNIDIFVFMDMPEDSNEYFIFAKKHNIPMYLLMEENVALHTENLNFSKHNNFKKIFTYLDELVDNKKYFKLNYSFRRPCEIPKNGAEKKKLCVTIAGNKNLNHPLELYSKRVEAIRWFEKHHPAEFDLYGVGWDKKHKFHGSKFKEFFNRIGLVRRVFTRKYPSYRGTVDKKFDILKKYKFSICYENAKDIPGWITEKIFDCFFAGCVPVYWGADNITNHVPKECFIDKRSFNTYDKLYEYMVNMPADVYSNYLNSIETFLQSEKFYPFTTDYFVEILTKEIVSDLL